MGGGSHSCCRPAEKEAGGDQGHPRSEGKECHFHR